MKMGGNQACNSYLQKHGISPRTPIKQKYDSPPAQLYKEVLKARVEGRPEPTELPKISTPVQKMGDANGMERLLGETDQEYINRQARLRDEAKARMAAKFGNSGSMGGVGSGNGSSSMSRSGMQGIGSDPSYNPYNGYSNNNDLGVNAVLTGFGSMLGSAVNTAKSLADEETLNSLKQSGSSFWGGITSSVSQVANIITAPDDSTDGLSELQRQVQSQRTNNSKYTGFGSDNTNNNTDKMAFSSAMASKNNPLSTATSDCYTNSTVSNLQEAPGLPGEDRNGVERLTGETDAQYVVRQTRLRDEARARMAAKFGGDSGSMSGVGSNNNHGIPNSSMPMSTPSHRGGVQSAPASGNARIGTALQNTKTPAKKVMNSNDFFSSFGE